MSPTNAELSAATVRALVDAATPVFGEVGFGAVALDDLARRAGVTRGAIYHHFGGKVGLFRAVLARVQTTIAERIAVRAGSGDAWQQLVLGSRAFVEEAASAAHRRILLIDGPAVLGWSAWREGDAATSQRELADALAALVDAGSLEADLAEPAAAALSGAMNDLALWLARDGAGEPDAGDAARAARVLDLLLAPLAPQRAP